MIKAENLRIGDLVMVSRDCAFPKGTMCAVTQIYPERVHEDKKGAATLSYTDDTDDGPWGTWCCNIEGIPISPEILNKNGFKEEFVGEYYTKPLDDEEYSLARYLAVERKSCNWAVFIRYRNLPDYGLIRHIQHVHELQHILWALSLDAEFKVQFKQSTKSIRE